MRHVLLVEENTCLVTLTKDALSKGSVSSTMHHVPNTVEAMTFLRRENAHSDAPRPHLILMNIPEHDGEELSALKAIKLDPVLKTIPLAVLTTSDKDLDVWESYQRHANCYLIKPDQPDEYKSMISNLSDFWLSVAALPPDGN